MMIIELISIPITCSWQTHIIGRVQVQRKRKAIKSRLCNEDEKHLI